MPFNVTASTPRLTVNATSNAYGNAGGGVNQVNDNYIDFLAFVDLASVSSQCLGGNWSSSFVILTDASGHINPVIMPGYNGALSTVPLSDAPGFSLNSPIGVRIKFNAGSTTIDGVAPGTCVFFTTLDEVTFTQLGAVVTVPQSGITPGVSSLVAGTIDTGNAMTGNYYKLVLRSSTGVILANPDFTKLAIGQTGTFNDTAATPNTWTIHGSIHNNVATTPPPVARVTQDTHRLGVSVDHDAFSTVVAAGSAITDGYLDVTMSIKLASTIGQTLFSRWPTSGNTPANSSFLINTEAAGKPAVIWFSPAANGGGFNAATATVPLQSVPGYVANAPFMLWAQVNVSPGTVNGLASGTAQFRVSFDAGNTWVAVGSVITGLGSNGISDGGSGGKVIGTIDANNAMTGQYFSVKSVSSTGAIRTFVDFAVVPIGAQSYTDPVGNVFTINGPVHFDNRVRSQSPTYPVRMYAGTGRWKILELLPIAPSNAQWGPAWAQYDTAVFETRIAYAKSLGANACKMASSGSLATGYPSTSVMTANITDYARLLRKYGLKHYHNLGHANEVAGADGSQRASEVAARVAHLNLWMSIAADLIIGVDICNEPQFGGGPSTWPNNDHGVNGAIAGDLSYYASEVRKAQPDLPISFSWWLSFRDMTTVPGIRMQAAMEMDYHDYHPYLTQGSSTTVGEAPAANDMATLESAPWFLGRYIAGEIGVYNTNANDVKTAWIDGLAAEATRPYSFGGTYFGDRNYQGSGGDSGSFGLTGDLAMESAFAAWAPAVAWPPASTTPPPPPPPPPPPAPTPVVTGSSSSTAIVPPVRALSASGGVSGQMDPGDVVDFTYDPGVELTATEKIASFTVGMSPEGGALGVTIATDATYGPKIANSGRLLEFFLSVASGSQSNAAFISGVAVAIAIRLVTDNAPPRTINRATAVVIRRLS